MDGEGIKSISSGYRKGPGVNPIGPALFSKAFCVLSEVATNSGLMLLEETELRVSANILVNSLEGTNH